MLTHSRGHHAAPRRHVVAPVVLTGLLVSEPAAVSLPTAATPSRASPWPTSLGGRPFDPADPAPSTAQGAPAAADVPPVQGLHIKAKPTPPCELPGARATT